MINPPRPVVLFRSSETAAAAASCGDWPARTKSLAALARTSFMIDSPWPVHEMAADELSA
jgi:hypothetical protein